MVAAAFAVYAAFQVHALLHHGYWGQDWIAHKTWVREAARDPWTFATQYARDPNYPPRTNPPLYDLIGGLIRRVVGLKHYLAAIGLFDVIAGLVGMGFVTRFVWRLIRSPVLRAACVVFLLFLPFAMIHAAVIANDALATPVFWAVLWLLARFDPRAAMPVFVRSAVGLAVALVAAVQVKFTFGCLIIAAALLLALQWWTGRLSARRMAIALGITVLIPGALTYAESVRFRREAGNSFGISPPRRLADAKMNPRSILWLRAADPDVLDAPPLNLTVAGSYDLLMPNKHSLAALLHLAVFTDILNIYQYDPYDTYFGRRTAVNHSRMQAAVRAALPASVLAFAAVVALTGSALWSAIVRRRADDLLLLTVLMASIGWFLSLVVLYPLIPTAYYSGWWLPRLHAPALLGFFLAAFVALDRAMARFERFHVAVLAWAVVQSALQLSFLWPTPTDAERPVFEANRDVAAAASKGPILRVLSWQDGWELNGGPDAWIADTTGIVIDRPPGAATERRRLHLRIRPGPSLPGSVGQIRVSAAALPPQLVTFDADREVDLDLSLAGGRNEVRLDLVAPPTVELPDDIFRRNVRLSEIAIR